MYKLKVNQYQIFVIDNRSKICKVFYNLEKARECIKELNDNLSHEWAYQHIKALDFIDIMGDELLPNNHDKNWY